MRFTIFGDEIRLVGFTIENGVKLLLTLALIGLVLLVRAALAALARPALRDPPRERVRFWVRQALNLAAAILIVLGILSIWFDDPTRLATALGLVTAGLAFALQRVVTALAGYFVILRGQTFGVGDRITMGGVRGDVIALGFIQTTIMEMGQPPAVQVADPAQWVRSRQYTGRVVTVSNARVFDEPVYNYTRDFPYLWEEISLPLKYDDNRERAEQILLECARRHTVHTSQMGEGALAAMRGRYFVHPAAFDPKVYFRLTDNWLELTVRFVVEDRGIRDVKDAMSRDILDAFDAAGIGIASATYEIVGLPPLRVVRGARATVGEG